MTMLMPRVRLGPGEARLFNCFLRGRNFFWWSCDRAIGKRRLRRRRELLDREVLDRQHLGIMANSVSLPIVNPILNFTLIDA